MMALLKANSAAENRGVPSRRSTFRDLGLQPDQTTHVDSTPTASIADRLLAACLAPIVFNFSILLVLSSKLTHGRHIFFPFRRLHHVSGDFVLFCFFLLPVIAGFVMGMTRLTTLLGHFFFTNHREVRDYRKTIAAWACLLLIAYLLSEVNW